MTFGESIKTCYKKSLDTDGRATRAEYWWFVLYFYISLAVFVLLGIFKEELTGESFVTDGVFFKVCIVLFTLHIAVYIVPRYTVTIRRLHDAGFSGGWVLLVFVPYLGELLLFVFSVMKSDGDNKYGPAPHNHKIRNGKPGTDTKTGKGDAQLIDMPAQTVISNSEQDKVHGTFTDTMIAVKYCRHCGRKIDYDSSAYCKYCGKDL